MAEIIDYTKCAFYNNGKCDNPNGMACNCVNNAVCYFKELKRLEQENAELKALKGLITVGSKQQYQCLQKIDELEQENERLKEEITELEEKFLTLNGKSYSYYLTLQEIKEKCNEARRTGRKAYLPIDILNVITKAEEE